MRTRAAQVCRLAVVVFQADSRDWHEAWLCAPGADRALVNVRRLRAYLLAQRFRSVVATFLEKEISPDADAARAVRGVKLNTRAIGVG